ncbi:MAG TPA: glutamine--fructose-6-phosphate transaminase (isomerizing) [Candidatus Desulfaltia sp.]|nr:glutamine--fructose-6-phosphate transaminase (isomerizing) [Candidatus Desulfaltia sp.]
MCGIIGYLGPKQALPVLLDGLKKLEYRGYDSAGVAILHNNTIQVRRVKGKIRDLEESLKASPLEGRCGLGHTRWATHGRPSEENAHPHRDCTGSLVVVHNGIIENYLPLKEKLSGEGHAFQTETDTEVIAHLVEKYFEGSLESAVRRALQDLEGAYAVAVISARDPDKIVAAKTGPPAVVGLGDEESFISSDINPILSHTSRVVFLEDNEMAVLEPAGVRFLDSQGNPLNKTVEHLSWNPLMIEKKGFKHFMLKEIFEQPQVIRDTLEGRISQGSGRTYLDETGLSPRLMQDLEKVLVIACGTSYHAGMAGKYFIESLAQIPVAVEYASEYRYHDLLLDSKTLVVVISQSGETADTLAALRAIKKAGRPTLAVSNVMNSSIPREAGAALYTHAGPEIGVAATKTFTAQLAALALLALGLAQAKGRSDEGASLPLIQDLLCLPHKLEKILAEGKRLEDLAQRFLGFSHFLYLGRWVSFPVALEGALKLKEISYLHAEGYAGGEMKHGPIALIDENMPTLAIVPKDRAYEKMLSNISEIKARSGYVLALAFDDDKEIMNHADEVIRVPVCSPLWSPFLTVLPLQLFAYHIAAKRGADVDQPRNLAKSVTVE